jgi:hypothetical protein
MRRLLSTRFDFLIYFESRNGTILRISGVDSIGKGHIPGSAAVIDDSHSTVIRIERLLIHRNDIIRMVILVWE